MEKILRNGVVIFPRRRHKVLLARKKRHIGVGLYNGYGGGIEPGETSKDAAVRELGQECGIDADPQALVRIAITDFHNIKSDGEQFVTHLDIYELTRCLGEPRESEEMGEPEWFPIDALPFNEMLPADRIWVPAALSGSRKLIYVEAWYGPRQQYLLKPVEIKLGNE